MTCGKFVLICDNLTWTVITSSKFALTCEQLTWCCGDIPLTCSNVVLLCGYFAKTVIT